ncbi:hypothetical protein P0082_03455 [Candidatus Haliotispira prima]|uniref:Uncharacterized protein n=1 Tax=Candidatus Haliotispira prima TaxID=3034016 RepID=A0ABY8ML84_9SPIO|nr:hypothetical protein P0082_03455 [Candidatus Haliotispira prima]
MKLVSSINEINYGSYDEGLDWNIQNYRVYSNGKNLTGKKAQLRLNSCLRFNIFTENLQAELEFLRSSEALRIMLVSYDTEHDSYLEKTWLLNVKHFSWEGSPEKYEIRGKGLGLDFAVSCDGLGALLVHFSHFDQYHIHFISHIHRADRKPLRNVNPFDFDTWSFSEKHAMLDCGSISLVLEGNNYTTSARPEPGAAPNFNLSYEWYGGYFPPSTRELRCQFWQQGTADQGAFAEEARGLEMRGLETQGLETRGLETRGRAASNPSALISDEELEVSSLREQMAPQYRPGRLPELAGSLLLMGHDSCSSESAIWVEQKVRYRLPRIVPSFGRSEPAISKNGRLLPDLEWNISAGKHLSLNFRPFNINGAPQLVFPLTQMQRIYGLFHGKLLDQFGDAIPIQKALGFIDYRRIQWRKR